MKKNIKIFGVVVLFIIIITLLLSIFYNTAFIPACILMTSLLVFTICYYIKDDKKNVMYILFTLGIILIIIALYYMIMRLI